MESYFVFSRRWIARILGMYRCFVRKPCCMVATIDYFSYGKKCSFWCKTFHCSCHATWLPYKTSITNHKSLFRGCLPTESNLLKLPWKLRQNVVPLVPDVSVGGGETCSMVLGSTLNPSKLCSFAAVFRTFNTSLTTALLLNFISKSTITLPHLKTKRMTTDSLSLYQA